MTARGRLGLGVAVLVIAGIVVGGLALGRSRAPLSDLSAAGCGPATPLVASLFSDDTTTAIRVSQTDQSDMRVLRTEPAKVLPGMFDSLLSVSPNSQRLAYVTAKNELMDAAHLYAIDVVHPEQRTELAAIPNGLWPQRPIWSPDGSQLAYVTADGTSPYTFRIWTVPSVAGTPVLKQQYPREVFLPPSHPALCWTSSTDVTLTGVTPPTSSPSAGSPSSGAIFASPATASPSGAPPPSGVADASGAAACALPVMSQNDPRWRHLFMRSAGDSIGGYGCALTATTMVLNYYGASMGVSDLNDCMGGNADPLYWGVAPRCSNGLVQGGVLAAFTWDRLDKVLAAGNPEIVGVVRGQTGSHFVVVTSGGGDVADGYRITDPWDGTTNKTLGYYTSRGYNLDWVVTYSGRSQGCGRLDSGLGVQVGGITDDGEYQGPVHVDPGKDGRSQGPVEIGQVGDSGGVIVPSPSPQASPSPATSSSATTATTATATTGTETSTSTTATASSTASSTTSVASTGTTSTVSSTTASATSTAMSTTASPSSTGTTTSAPTPSPNPPHLTLPPAAVVRFTPIPPQGLTVAAEGVYEVLIRLRIGSSVQVVTMKFTIDHTPPRLGVDFLDPVDALQTAATLTTPPLPVPFLPESTTTTPILKRPGTLQIQHMDTLSGVHEVDYSLDDAPSQPYTDAVNDMRVISVDLPGPHTISFSGVDVAGNATPLTTQPFIVVDISAPAVTPPPSASPATTPVPTRTATPPPTAAPSAKPTATPAPTATPCPPLTVLMVTATSSVDPATYETTTDVQWTAAGGCGVTATVVGEYAIGQTTMTFGPFAGASGTLVDRQKACIYQAQYVVTLTDSAGRKQLGTSGVVTNTVCG